MNHFILLTVVKYRKIFLSSTFLLLSISFCINALFSCASAANIDKTPSYQQLYNAVINGDIRVIRIAVEQGADINQVDEYGIPFLNHAANFNQLAMVEQLIELGAKVNQTDENGWTPLLVAVTYLHTDIVKALVKNYADVTIADKDGLTPLKQAKIKNDKNLYNLLIARLEKQQYFNISNPKAFATAIYETAQDKFYGIEKINRLVAPKTFEQVIKYYKNVLTKQGYSLILRVLSSDKVKNYTPFKDYLLLLNLAKQHIKPKYWLSEFTLYGVLGNSSIYQQPLRGIMIQNQRLDILLSNIKITKELILFPTINKYTDKFCFRQADLDIEYLLRANSILQRNNNHIQLKNTYVIKQQQQKLQQLLTLVENEITNYCFGDIIATLASTDTATWLKERVNQNLQTKIKQNNTEKYVLYITDWQNNTYITINVWLKAQYAPTIIKAIKANEIDSVYQAINTMKVPTPQKLIDYLLPVWGINKTDTEKVELQQARIKNKEIK